MFLICLCNFSIIIYCTDLAHLHSTEHCKPAIMWLKLITLPMSPCMGKCDHTFYITNITMWIAQSVDWFITCHCLQSLPCFWSGDWHYLLTGFLLFQSTQFVFYWCRPNVICPTESFFGELLAGYQQPPYCHVWHTDWLFLWLLIASFPESVSYSFLFTVTY